MLKVEGVNKSFNEVKAVSSLSFNITEGEIVGLLGPNGAGKTTTMRIVTGFIAPDSGDVFIDNIPVSKNTVVSRLSLGYLPENNPLYKDMLVSDILNYSAKLKDLNGNNLKSSLNFVVKSTDISDVYYRPVKELSKGYKQRVGLAIALLNKPKLLILDEPTEGLDPKQRSEISDLIKTLSKDRTIIISTHVLPEIENICNRVIIINKGTKVYDGPPNLVSGNNNILLEISGANVVQQLKSLPNVTLDVLESDDDRYKIRLNISNNEEIQPELSRLVKLNNWTIWKLVPASQELESIFREVTS